MQQKSMVFENFGVIYFMCPLLYGSRMEIGYFSTQVVILCYIRISYW